MLRGTDGIAKVDTAHILAAMAATAATDRMEEVEPGEVSEAATGNPADSAASSSAPHRKQKIRATNVLAAVKCHAPVLAGSSPLPQEPLMTLREVRVSDALPVAANPGTLGAGRTDADRSVNPQILLHFNRLDHSRNGQHPVSTRMGNRCHRARSDRASRWAQTQTAWAQTELRGIPSDVPNEWPSERQK